MSTQREESHYPAQCAQPGQSAFFSPPQTQPPSYLDAISPLPSTDFVAQFSKITEAFRTESEKIKRIYPVFQHQLLLVEQALSKALMSREPKDIEVFYQQIKPITDKIDLCEKSRPMLQMVNNIGGWLLLAGMAILILGSPAGLASAGFYMALTGLVTSAIASRHDNLKLKPSTICDFNKAMLTVNNALKPVHFAPSAPIADYQQPAFAYKN